MDNLWKLGEELRGHSKVTEDCQWLAMTSKLAELARTKGERMNNLEYSKNPVETKSWEKLGFHEDIKFENLNLGLMNLDLKMNGVPLKGSFRDNVYNINPVYQKSNANSFNSVKMNTGINKYANINSAKDANNNINGTNSPTSNNNTGSNNNSNNNVADKRFKRLPSTEMLPRNEILGGYIFVCNNDTMQEDLKRQLFGQVWLVNWHAFQACILYSLYGIRNMACLLVIVIPSVLLLQGYLFSFTTIPPISFMGSLRLLALGVLILIRQLGKTKNVKASQGFLHR